MELISPDILLDARQLSGILLGMGIVIGGVLWLAGWRSHRFWIVLGFTVLGGIWGLQNAPALKSQPLVAAICVGLAAGMLALTLIRFGTFIAGGYAGLILMQTALPNFDQPLVSFFVGGVLGFVMFRYWAMALTSLSGVVLIGYAVLAILDKLGKLDGASWCETNAHVLNAACGLTALGGFLIQLWLDWRQQAAGGDSKGEKKDDKKPKSAGTVFASLIPFRRAG